MKIRKGFYAKNLIFKINKTGKMSFSSQYNAISLELQTLLDQFTRM